ncbi:hypothetical protein KEJ37_03890 [Candidatus Bathyarchaeota archaeon]|nr:hypothetical protein [Candidatus Bathyarchaeota archaeon]
MDLKDVRGNREVYVKYCSDADVERVWRNAYEAKRLGFTSRLSILLLMVSKTMKTL